MRCIDEAEFVAATPKLIQEGCLYNLVDPGDAPERRLTGKDFGQAGLVRNPFLAQKPSERIYFQRVSGQTLDFPSQLAEERSGNKGPLLEPVPFCGWIISSHPLRTLAGYLSRQLSQKSPEGKKALFRFYDPRVLRHLPRILWPWQLSALLGPVDRWIYLDNFGKLREIAPHQEKRHYGAPRLTLEQWRAVRRIGLFNQCLERYLSLPEEGRHETMPFDVIDSLIVSAAQHRVTDSANTVAFVLHGLATNPQFYRHPIMQKLLARLDDRVSYISLTNQLADEEWDAISTYREND